MIADPFTGRSEITSEEYRTWVDGNAAVAVRDAPGRAKPAAPASEDSRDWRTHETAFRERVVGYAESRGWRCYWTWNSRHSPAGFPDLLLIRPPDILAVELKVGNGRVAVEQWDWLSAFERSGVSAYVVRPEQWAFIEEVLK